MDTLERWFFWGALTLGVVLVGLIAIQAYVFHSPTPTPTPTPTVVMLPELQEVLPSKPVSVAFGASARPTTGEQNVALALVNIAIENEVSWVEVLDTYRALLRAVLQERVGGNEVAHERALELMQDLIPYTGGD